MTDLFPSPDFVARLNSVNPGPYRSALDPLTMLLWHQATAPLPPLILVVSSGC